MKRTSYLVSIGLLVAAIVLIGCGGGGSTGLAATTGGITTGTTVTTGSTGGTGSTGQSTVTINVNPEEKVETNLKTTRVEIPPGTFAVRTIVTITEQAQPTIRPSNASVVAAGPNVEITTSSSPVGPLTIRYPVEDTDLVAALQTPDGWWPLEGSTEGNWYKVTIPAEIPSLNRSTRSVAQTFVTFLGRLPIEKPRPSLLVHLAGSTNYRGAALIVHGWHDSLSDFRLLADKLVASGLYPAVYGFEYNWKGSITAPANDLAKKLDDIEREVGPKQLTIIAHSMGGLVSRQALESVGATQPVRQLVSVCTPHLGSVPAKTFVTYLNHQHLNSPLAWGFAWLDTPSIREMQPGSTFLKQLNQPHGQTGQVDYLLVSGQNDIVVDERSGQAAEVQLEDQTGGLIWRTSEPGGHGHLVKNPTGIDRLLAILAENQPQKAGVSFELTPASTEPAGETYWAYDIRLTNNTDEEVLVTDILMMLFDANGVWRGSWWYQPNHPGPFFPTAYYPWDRTISPGDSAPSGFFDGGTIGVYCDLEKSPIAACPPERQTQTAVMIARIKRADGSQFNLEKRVLCTYQDRQPAQAQTRAPRRDQDPKAGGFGPIRR